MLIFNKKFIIILSLVILLNSLLITKSFAIVPQAYEFYVNDSANVLNTDTEQYIINMNKKLQEKTGAQIVVVTVNNLDNSSIEECSTELFRSYGIGDKEKNNGVLLLVSIQDRKTRIEVGYGLEGRLTDGKTGRILDNYVVPYFKDNNWNDGVKNGFNAILKEVCEEYSITIDGAEQISATEADEFTFEDGVQYLTAFIVFVLCLISRHIFNKTLLRKWAVGMRNWYCSNNY